MATLTANKPFDAAETTIVKVDSNAGPHDFIYKDFQQVIYLQNDEAVPLTFNFLGDGVTTAPCTGLPDPINVSAGFDVVVAAGDVATLFTQRAGGYMGAVGNSVAIAVTGSTAPALSFIWMVEHS